ncbi:MAG: hypothetical protein HZY79_00410 [Rhodoblastus sp.]|nr:MAG: hypothetical protein HZY79_00410 [Rhodoblastus sp.]
MADLQTYVWKGPPTAVEVWPAGAPDAASTSAAAPLISERVAPGKPLSIKLDPDHPTVRGWLAFGLVEVGVVDTQGEPAATTQVAPVAGEASADAISRKERRNG